MKVILLMLTCALCASTTASLIEATPPSSVTNKVSITFTGTIKSIELMGERELKVIPVDFDANFALVVQIESVTPKDTPLKEGAEQVFAIHSPAQLFSVSAEEVIGKKYRFTLNWKQVNNRSRFSQLTADLITQSQSKFKLPHSNPFRDMLPVDLCAVVQEPEAYDGKLIRLQAVWYWTFEGSILYPGTGACGDFMRPHFVCANDAACKVMWDTLKKNLAGDGLSGRVGVIALGRLRYRRFLSRREIRLGFSQYEFEVTRIEEFLKPPPKPKEGAR